VGMTSSPVIRLPHQPGADPESERRMLIEKREGMLQPGLQHDRAGYRATLAHPQARQAKSGAGYRTNITRPLGQVVGAVEVSAARFQVTIGVQGALALSERDGEFVAQTSIKLRPTRDRMPVGLA